MLSILIPSIPERLTQLQTLIALYETYIEMYFLGGIVEIVSIVDNKTRSIGEKRKDLIRIARGKYFVISDDDDELMQAYFKNILVAISQDKDVVTYLQSAWINNDYSLVKFTHNGTNDEFQKDSVTNRKAWHCCTWKRDVVIAIDWDPINWGEDSSWADRANAAAKTSWHINEVMHTYRHDSNKTAAFQ